jgi:hypothetical protein
MPGSRTAGVESVSHVRTADCSTPELLLVVKPLDADVNEDEELAEDDEVVDPEVVRELVVVVRLPSVVAKYPPKAITITTTTIITTRIVLPMPCLNSKFPVTLFEREGTDAYKTLDR